MREKYDEILKKNKEYAKDMFKYMKEHTDLKNNAKKDSEVLADTLSFNQVLTEEIKVKDQIIKANEMLSTINQNVGQDDMEEVVGESIITNVAKWSSNGSQN